MPRFPLAILAEPEVVSSIGKVADKRCCQPVCDLSHKDNGSRQAGAEEDDFVEPDESV